MVRLRRLPRLMLIVLLLVGWRRYAIAGTNALFTARTTAAGNVFRAGTVQLASTPASGATLFAMPALLPGEAIEAPVTIRNAGTLDFSYTLRVAAPAGNPLTESSAHGLQLEVTRCAGGRWVAPIPEAPTYVCASAIPGVGSTTETVYRGPIPGRAAASTGAPRGAAAGQPWGPPGAGAPIPIGAPLIAGEAHALKLRVSLPESALGAGLVGHSIAFDLLWQAEALVPPARLPGPTSGAAGAAKPTSRSLSPAAPPSPASTFSPRAL